MHEKSTAAEQSKKKTHTHTQTHRPNALCNMLRVQGICVSQASPNPSPKIFSRVEFDHWH